MKRVECTVKLVEFGYGNNPKLCWWRKSHCSSGHLWIVHQGTRFLTHFRFSVSRKKKCMPAIIYNMALFEVCHLKSLNGLSAFPIAEIATNWSIPDFQTNRPCPLFMRNYWLIPSVLWSKLLFDCLRPLFWLVQSPCLVAAAHLVNHIGKLCTAETWGCSFSQVFLLPAGFKYCCKRINT